MNLPCCTIHKFFIYAMPCVEMNPSIIMGRLDFRKKNKAIIVSHTV